MRKRKLEAASVERIRKREGRGEKIGELSGGGVVGALEIAPTKCRVGTVGGARSRGRFFEDRQKFRDIPRPRAARSPTRQVVIIVRDQLRLKKTAHAMVRQENLGIIRDLAALFHEKIRAAQQKNHRGQGRGGDEQGHDESIAFTIEKIENVPLLVRVVILCYATSRI